MSVRSRRIRRFAYGAAGLGLLFLMAWEVVSWLGVGPAAVDHADVEVRALAGTEIYAPEELGLPIALALVGGWLAVADAHLDPTLHVLDESDGSLVAAFGRGGQGPGEFQAPKSLVPAPGRADAFWVYDIELQRLTFIDLSRLADGSAPRGGPDVPTLGLESDAPITDALFAPDGAGLVALGFFPDARLRFFDGQGRPVGGGGPLPPADREVPPHVLQHAYQGRMVSRPDGSRLAIGSRHAGRLEIVPPAGEPVRLAEVPFAFAPRFEIGVAGQGAVMITGPDLRFGYVDVAATQERIYGLFSGRLRGAHRDRAPLGRHVHVFDWEGRLLEALELGEDAFAIAVSAEDRALFALRHLPTPGVLRYELDPGAS